MTIATIGTTAVSEDHVPQPEEIVTKDSPAPETPADIPDINATELQVRALFANTPEKLPSDAEVTEIASAIREYRQLRQRPVQSGLEDLRSRRKIQLLKFLAYHGIGF